MYRPRQPARFVCARPVLRLWHHGSGSVEFRTKIFGRRIEPRICSDRPSTAQGSDCRKVKEELSPSRQIRFHQLLSAARKTWLHDALSDAAGKIDHKILKAELSALIPDDVQQILAAAGIRDEMVFPAPVILKFAPHLVGYYRLLLGIPHKSFYTSGMGMSLFKNMETKGVLGARQAEQVEWFCSVMAESLSELVRQLSSTITRRDIQELPILTYGSQLRGSNNNSIGRQATVDVFLAVAEVVKPYITAETGERLTIANSSGRTVTITLAADPDIRIEELMGDKWRKIVAIEIKGGTDKSNAHNRAGEAEKSHQKAKNDGFRDFWTIIAKRGLDLEKLKSESPTTNEWFDVAQVLAREGEDWRAFVRAKCGQVGIPEVRDSTQHR